MDVYGIEEDGGGGRGSECETLYDDCGYDTVRLGGEVERAL